MQYYNILYFCVCLNFKIMYTYKKCEVPENVGDIGKHRDNLEWTVRQVVVRRATNLISTDSLLHQIFLHIGMCCLRNCS